MSLPADFEPAVRDEKKLRRTAWILVAIMVLGGTLLPIAYNKWVEGKFKDTRPAVIYRITKERDLRMVRQDGKQANLFDLRGHVVAINIISLKHPETAARSFEVMQRLSGKYSSRDDFNLVTLVIDPIAPEESAARLAQAADSLGIKLPQWWLGTNDKPTLDKFIKNELKTSVYPVEENGKWTFDTSVILIDRNGHIRRGVVPQKRGGMPYVANFDFDVAAEWDGRGVKTGTPNNNVVEMENLLHTTIDLLLAEPFVK